MLKIPNNLLLGIAALALFLGGLYLGYVLTKPEIVTKTEVRTVRHVETDTVYVQTPPKRIEVPVPVPQVIERDRIVHVPTRPPGSTVDGESPGPLGFRRYTQTVEDSVLTATLEAEVDGHLLSWGLDYSVRFPEVTTTVTDTVFVETTNTVLQRQFPLRVGVNGTLVVPPSGNPVVSVGPNVGLSLNRRLYIQYGIGVAVYPEIKRDPTHIVVASYKFF